VDSKIYPGDLSFIQCTTSGIEPEDERERERERETGENDLKWKKGGEENEWRKSVCLWCVGRGCL